MGKSIEWNGSTLWLEKVIGNAKVLIESMDHFSAIRRWGLPKKRWWIDGQFPEDAVFKGLVEKHKGEWFDHTSPYYVSEGFIGCGFNSEDGCRAFLSEPEIVSYLDKSWVK